MEGLGDGGTVRKEVCPSNCGSELEDWEDTESINQGREQQGGGSLTSAPLPGTACKAVAHGELWGRTPAHNLKRSVNW